MSYTPDTIQPAIKIFLGYSSEYRHRIWKIFVFLQKISCAVLLSPFQEDIRQVLLLEGNKPCPVNAGDSSRPMIEVSTRRHETYPPGLHAPAGILPGTVLFAFIKYEHSKV